MKVMTTIQDVRALLDSRRCSGATVGFVPTMGALHEGHLSLIRAAAGECEFVIASIFVNPLQFAPTEDLGSYPRPFDRDLELAEEAGAHVIFAPSVEEMYPQKSLVTVAVDAELAGTLEGVSRPTHFGGVATVVSKLFSIVGPCRAYFGEKDYQQLLIVRRLVTDLSLPVDVRGCPIVREEDGLAMSSRNTYLNTEERQAAPILHQALQSGAQRIAEGERDPAAVHLQMEEVVAKEPLVELDYAQVADARTLRPLSTLAGEVRLLIAARVGTTRLIDNVGAVVNGR